MTKNSEQSLTLDDINRIESYILKKLSTLPDSDNSVYSDTNLSKGIFQLLLVLLAEKREQMRKAKHWDYFELPPGWAVSSCNTVSWVAGGESTVCSECKTKHPNMTHCVHKTISNNAGKI